MNLLKKINSYDDRDFYLLLLPSIGHWHKWPDTRPYFRLTVFFDVDQIENDDVFLDFAKDALDAGARSMLCAGSADEKMHHLIYLLRNNNQYEPEPEDCCMTNLADKNEPLDKILWDSFFADYSCDRFEECNPPVVACLLEYDPRTGEIEKLSHSLEDTFEKVLSREQ